MDLNLNTIFDIYRLNVVRKSGDATTICSSAGLISFIHRVGERKNKEESLSKAKLEKEKKPPKVQHWRYNLKELENISG